MKNLFTYILTGLLLCVSFAACSKNKDKDDVYINGNKDYSIVFPKKWMIQKKDKRTTIALNRREFGRVSMNIVVQPLALPKNLENTTITPAIMEKALGSVMKNRIREGLRKLDNEEAFWHIITLDAPESVDTLSMYIYQVVCYQDKKLFVISCNAAAESPELADAKLTQFRPLFLETIKSFQFLKKRAVAKQKTLYYFGALICSALFSFFLRLVIIRRSLSVYSSAIIAAILWAASFLILFFLLKIKVAVMSLSIVFLIAFYPLSPYFTYGKKK